MLVENLLELVERVRRQKAEAQNIEVKAAHLGCPQRLYDTLSSFSNQDGGGVILFGLDEKQDFKAVGVYDLQALQKNVTEQCLQMEPVVRAVFTFAEIEGKPVCSAEIPGLDLPERPCYYRGSGRLRGAYVRVGEADLPMTDYELYSCEAFRRHLRDDERVVERADAEALDTKKLMTYLQRKKEDRPQFARMKKSTALEMLNIFREGKPTLAGMMNFGLYPQGYFPQFGVTATVVPGLKIGVTDAGGARFLDNKRIEGTLAEMLEGALAFLRRNMRVRTIIDRASGMRRDREEYPVAAVREAILNALIHRDYSVYTEGMAIQFNLFSDRLEIHSPGNLYGRMTVDQLGIAKPDLRNPTLAVMAEVMTDAENRYSGIPTMRLEMKKWGLPPPVFENRRNEFVVTLYNGQYAEKAAEDKPQFNSGVQRGNLLSFCKVPRTRAEIAAYLGIRTVFYAMDKYIRPLVQSGALKLTIPERPKSKNQKYYS